MFIKFLPLNKGKRTPKRALPENNNMNEQHTKQFKEMLERNASYWKKRAAEFYAKKEQYEFDSVRYMHNERMGMWCEGQEEAYQDALRWLEFYEHMEVRA